MSYQVTIYTTDNIKEDNSMIRAFKSILEVEGLIDVFRVEKNQKETMIRSRGGSNVVLCLERLVEKNNGEKETERKNFIHYFELVNYINENGLMRC